MRLPAAPDAVSVETPAKPRDAVPPRTVLLVDDNVDGIEAMSMILRRSGHDVRIALDGVAALAEAATFQPEVVLLDIGMPGMSGYELAKRLRQMPFGERAILVAITGWGQPSDREHARAAGFDYHMTKPADPAALRTVLVDGRPEKFIAIPSSRG